jgi:hypothetical protein
MSALPSRPPGGGSRQWTRGGATSATVGPLARTPSVGFKAAGAAVPSSSTSAAGSSGAAANGSRGRGGAARGIRGSSSARGGRGGNGGGGRGGGRANALELAGALGDDDGDDGAGDLIEGFDAPLPAEDTEETKAGKADARLQRFTSKFDGNRFEEVRTPALRPSAMGRCARA